MERVEKGLAYIVVLILVVNLSVITYLIAQPILTNRDAYVDRNFVAASQMINGLAQKVQQLEEENKK